MQSDTSDYAFCQRALCCARANLSRLIATWLIIGACGSFVRSYTVCLDTHGEPEASQTFFFFFDMSAWFNVVLQNMQQMHMEWANVAGAKLECRTGDHEKNVKVEEEEVSQSYIATMTFTVFIFSAYPTISTHQAQWPASEWPFSPVRACSWIVDCWYENEALAAVMCVFAHWTDPSPRSSSWQEAVRACSPLPPPPLAPAPNPAQYGRRRHGWCYSSFVCPPVAAQSSPLVLSLAACATGILTVGWAWRDLKALHSAAGTNDYHKLYSERDADTVKTHVITLV